jgi:putative tricarboxylic transport membrane protein
MAALTMHGMLPGPMLPQNSGEILYTVFIGAFVANALMLCVALLGSRWIARITRVPLSLLAPMTIVLSLVGAFAANGDVFDVYLALAMGLGGFVLRLLKMPLAALVLGMILGAPLESYFLQAHVLYGSLWAAFTRPVCLTLLLLTLAAVGWSLMKEFHARKVEPPLAPAPR